MPWGRICASWLFYQELIGEQINLFSFHDVRRDRYEARVHRKRPKLLVGTPKVELGKKVRTIVTRLKLFLSDDPITCGAHPIDHGA
jgi:hypothetical protein